MWIKQLGRKPKKKKMMEEHNKRHKRTKDDPNAIFAYNYKRNIWEWRTKFDSKEENPRYTESINKSVEYLKDVFK